MSDQHDTLTAKLDQLDARYAEVAEQMNDPEVASDAQRIVGLAKEHARLARVVEPYRRYRDLARQLADAEALAAAGDTHPEMRALAEAEVEALRPRVEEALHSLRDKDVLYVANAPAVEMNKLMTMFGRVLGTAGSTISFGRTINSLVD